MQKVAIIQDRSTSAPNLFRLCEGAFSGFEVVANAECVDAGIQIVRQFKPDLVVVDVDLPDGSGFDVFEATRELHYGKAVFCPNNRFWLKAARFQAMMLLKNDMEENLILKLSEWGAGQDKEAVSDLYSQCFREWNGGNLEKIFVPGLAGKGFVEVQEIVKILDLGNLRVLQMASGESISTHKKLSYWAKVLALDPFARAAQSALINLGHVEAFNPEKNTRQLQLCNGEELDVERALISRFQLKFNLFNARSAFR